MCLDQCVNKAAIRIEDLQIQNFKELNVTFSGQCHLEKIVIMYSF